MTAPVRLQGYALHAGVVTSVELARHEGAITFGTGSQRAPLATLRVERTDFGVALCDGRGFTIDLAEHLLAAIGGLGVRQGLAVTLEGPELPLLDGGAREFADALLRLEIPAEPPELVVETSCVLRWGESSYAFSPHERVEMSVETDYEQPALGAQRASWKGDWRAFLADIAPARTFGFAAQANELWSRGRAQLALRAQGPSRDDAASKAFVDAVVILDEAGHPTLVRQAPLREGEIARHKLLDLIGDFAFYGGPPMGRVVARRPGHTASHRIIGEAMSRGILRRR